MYLSLSEKISLDVAGSCHIPCFESVSNINASVFCKCFYYYTLKSFKKVKKIYNIIMK